MKTEFDIDTELIELIADWATNGKPLGFSFAREVIRLRDSKVENLHIHGVVFSESEYCDCTKPRRIMAKPYWCRTCDKPLNASKQY